MSEQGRVKMMPDTSGDSDESLWDIPGGCSKWLDQKSWKHELHRWTVL